VEALVPPREHLESHARVALGNQLGPVLGELLRTRPALGTELRAKLAWYSRCVRRATGQRWSGTKGGTQYCTRPALATSWDT
jgi:hypothetical protein